jgi:hypothetical protein
MTHSISIYSLKEYLIKNLLDINSIYYILYIYENEKFKEYNRERINPLEEKRVFLPKDGIFKISVYQTEDYIEPIANYILHNLTNILKIRQKFLTDLLVHHKCSPCNHNNYYNYISFNLLLDTYNLIIKNKFLSEVIPDNLYKLEYIFSKLKEYERIDDIRRI